MVNPAYLVGAGATIGALLRYGTNQYVSGFIGSRTFPYGTFVVNVVGTFVLALITFLGASDAVLYAVGTGACGSYTTFSSFSVDTIRLWEDGNRFLSGWYTTMNLLGALLVVGLADGLVNIIS
ncbi:fluoride efflux transporter FluC [Halococcus saccharolyticus]|uniref:Fluoride-specific ion channel FluC n=1 Tax=Halococcus saccharolyticus DSM 5350 TaxID=1227455 RepID=M0MG36_9EURY|nr:integral membrane protein/crcB-like protein [Halococcus saccharolyticus DSM 5350]